MSSTNGASVTNGHVDRGERGRFAPGNRVAAGTRQAHLAKLRKAFFDCLTESDIADVTAALLTAAKGGCVASSKLLFEKIFGRTGVDVRVDEDEIEISEDERREQFLNRFARLSPEAQAQIRAQLRERKSTTLSESSP